jgi:hypothetical protein
MIRIMSIVAVLAAFCVPAWAKAADYVTISGLTCTIINGAPKVQGIVTNNTGTVLQPDVFLFVAFKNASNVPAVADAETWASSTSPGQSAPFWTIGEANPAIATATVSSAMDANNDPIPTAGTTIVPCH